jgi:hypothetical protein
LGLSTPEETGSCGIKLSLREALSEAPWPAKALVKHDKLIDFIGATTTPTTKASGFRMDLNGSM